MIKTRENKGVTLIAIIVTIIILIILAGISISAITGNNSLIKQAGKAKYESGAANEREILELEIAKSMDKSLDGTVTAGNLGEALAGIAEVSQQGKYINVAFNDGGKKYRIDPYGNIKENNRKQFDNPTSVYAKLYTDHTLILSSFDYTDPSREVQTDYSNTGAWRSNDFTKVIIYDEIAPSSGNNMFIGCGALEEIEKIENLHTEFMTSMHRMFINCSSLKELDLSYFDTKNVTSMNSMFWNCAALESVDLSSFDTKNVTDLYGMFNVCYALKEVDLSSFDTSTVTNMGGLFFGCHSCTEIKIGDNFDTSNVTSMSGMFAECYLLKEIDTRRFNTSNVTNMSKMFNACGRSIDGEFKLDLKDFDTRKVTDMSLMFSGCSTIHTLDLSSFHTDALTSMTRMFLNCSKLETVNLANAELSSVTNMWQIFGNDNKLKEINFKSADFSSVTNYDLFFSGDSRIPITITVSYDTEKADAQVNFLTARRQESRKSVPTYITEDGSIYGAVE